MAKTTADKLRDMFDSERIRSDKALELLEELESGTVRAWGERLTEIADLIEQAQDSVEGYQGAEGRDEKADAKQETLDAFEGLLSKILELDDPDELPDLPNLCETPAVFEIVRRSGEG